MTYRRTVLTLVALLATLAACRSRDIATTSVAPPASVALPSATISPMPSAAAPLPSMAEPASESEAKTASEPPTAARPTPRPRETRCVRPIAEFCRGPCPTRAARENELRSLIARYKATGSGCPRIATLGRCGRLYVVEEADLYTSATAYFDETGRLVAAERTSDTNGFCQGSFNARYGDVPPCTPTVTEDMCAGVARRDDGL